MKNPQANDFLVANQVIVVDGEHRRRFDVVAYLNGFPPDQQQNATDLVLRQMETFAEEWSPEAGS
jgi:hypothetical protein